MVDMLDMSEDLETSRDRSRLRRYQLNARLLQFVANPRLYVEEKDADGDFSQMTLLHLCGYSDRYEAACRALLGPLGRLVVARNSHGETPLHVAANSGSTRIVRLLLDYARQHMTDEERKQWLRVREWSGRMSTALHLAVRQGSFRSVNLLLKAGADPRILDSGGVSCEVIAVNRNPHLLSLLSSAWYAHDWHPGVHHRWPEPFQEDVMQLLLVLRHMETRFYGDVRFCLVRALAELYRATRLRKGFLKRMR